MLPFHDEFGEEHVSGPDRCPMCGSLPPEKAHSRDPYSDAQVLAMLALMIESDLVGTVALILRSQRGHTYDMIGRRFRVCKGMTRQAVEQRVEKLADKYPGIAPMLIDICKRQKINGNSKHSRTSPGRNGRKPAGSKAKA